MIVAATPMQTRQLLKRIGLLIRPQWRLLLIVTGCILGVALFTILPPYLLGLIIDQGIGHHDIGMIIKLCVFAFAAWSLGDLVNFAQQYLTMRIGQNVTNQIRASLYAKMMRVPFTFYKRYSLGDIIARIINDVDALQMSVATTFVNSFAYLAILLCTLGFMFWFNIVFAVVAVAVLTVSVVVTRLVGKRGRTMSATTQRAGAELMTYLNETLNIQGILAIKSFGQQVSVTQRFITTNGNYAQNRLRMAVMNQWFMKLLYLVANLGSASIYLVGSLQVLTGHATIGQVIASVTLLGQLYQPANQLALTWVEFQKSLSICERVFTVLDEPDEEDAAMLSEVTSALVPQGVVQFKDVTFTYPDGNAPVLQHISFTVNPDEVVAIVGASGTGKTTLAYLLTRIYEPDSGNIVIDDIDIRATPRQLLSKWIGVMVQEPYLFNLSVQENIAFGDPGASFDKIIAAAHVAAIHDVICQLPQGYDTILGERGYLLSGGERQRIALARVVLKQPRILILDEATSSLDSTSENLIQTALATLTSGRGLIVIAHRLSTIRDADQILVLDQGRIVERGRHSDLLLRRGVYCRLYEHQTSTQRQAETPILSTHTL